MKDERDYLKELQDMGADAYVEAWKKFKKEQYKKIPVKMATPFTVRWGKGYCWLYLWNGRVIGIKPKEWITQREYYDFSLPVGFGLVFTFRNYFKHNEIVLK